MNGALPESWGSLIGDARRFWASVATLRRLEYLHSFRDRLDSAWFARPTSVVWQNGRPALRLEDPGGTVLEKRLGRRLELQLALRLGIGLASALSRFHAQLRHTNLFGWRDDKKAEEVVLEQ
jgi:hypothetical protein